MDLEGLSVVLDGEGSTKVTVSPRGEGVVGRKKGEIASNLKIRQRGKCGLVGEGSDRGVIETNRTYQIAEERGCLSRELIRGRV